MSIQDQIAGFLRDGRLVALPMLVRTSPRRVYLSPEVNDMVSMPFSDDEEGERFAECRAHLENFSRNNRIGLGWDPDNHGPTAAIARVRPTNLYVFDFRSKDDIAGIRVFGGFAKKDWFVGLTWEFREDVDWEEEILRCRAAWSELFGAPLQSLGTNPNDYLSGNYSIV